MKLWHVLAYIVLSTTSAFAYKAGGANVVGYSGKTSGLVCNVCHADAAITPKVTITGPATLTAGMTAQYTATVNIMGLPAATDAGIDIAASDSAAVLAAVSTTIVANGGELSHNGALTLAGGGGGGGGKSATVMFNVTAPPTNGTLTLFADGVVGEGLDAVDTSHGATTTLAITVTGGVDPGAGGNPDGGSDPAGGKMDGPGDMATGELVGDMAGQAALGSAFPKGCSFAGDGAGGDGALALLLLVGVVGLAVRRARSRRAA